jgi:hypothetical protein
VAVLGHDVLATYSRQERRILLRSEERARKSGEWGEWETLTFPPGSAGRRWAADFTTAHRNRVFSVLDRTLKNGIRHLAVTSLSQERPSWWEMQRIKNEIAGEDATAVEVYPPQTEVVDGADMFHIWVVTGPLDFGFKR